MPRSKAHFHAIIQLGDAVCEAVVDTGGAKSMIDYSMAKRLGLPVELAEVEGEFGRFYGPSADSLVGYHGRIPGPIKFKFDEKVEFELPELKVIKNGEPICLIGSDLMANG